MNLFRESKEKEIFLKPKDKKNPQKLIAFKACFIDLQKYGKT